MFLIFSFNAINHINQTNQINERNHRNQKNQTDTSTHSELLTPNSKLIILPGIISLIIAIADEIYQSSISSRNASITDVFIDLIGIILALFLISKYSTKLSLRGAGRRSKISTN
jgi:Ca2+/Na+ antiporter